MKKCRCWCHGTDVVRAAARRRVAIASATDLKKEGYDLSVLLMGWVSDSHETNIDSFETAFWLLQGVLSV